MTQQSEDDIRRRLNKLENADDRQIEKLNDLSQLVSKLSQLVEIHANLAPEVQQLRIDLSNAKLIQKGFVWVTGVIATSGITIAATFIFERFV